MEFNTRRFVVDERKELLYRANVQNRVYRQEIIDLDKEIFKLENNLEHDDRNLMEKNSEHKNLERFSIESY